MIFSRDTSPDAERFLIQLLREKTFFERLAMVGQLNDLARRLCLSGLRERHPDDGAEATDARYAELTLGRELAAPVLAARAARRSRNRPDGAVDAKPTG